MNNKRRKAIEVISTKLGELKEEVEALHGEEEETYDNMPEGLQGSERGEISQSAIDSLYDATDSLDSAIASLEGATE